MAVMLLGLPAAPPSAAAEPAHCRSPRLNAANLPTTLSLDTCDIVGRPITAHGLSLRVPAPGEASSIAALTSTSEVHFSVRTTSEGEVKVSTGDESVSGSEAPTNDDEPADMGTAATWSTPGTTAGATVSYMDDRANRACNIPADRRPDRSVWYQVRVQGSGVAARTAGGREGWSCAGAGVDAAWA